MSEKTTERILGPFRKGISWDVYIKPSYMGRYFDIQLYRTHDKYTDVIVGLEIETFNHYEEEPGESLGIGFSPLQMQALIDCLWKAGFRPTEGSGSAGSLAATQEHLKTVQDVMNRTLTLVEKQRSPLIIHTTGKLP
jgi:hypothetical protein